MQNLQKSPCNINSINILYEKYLFAKRLKNKGLSIDKPLFGSGIRIRTSTYGVRVRCATVTQYRYLNFASGIIQCAPPVVKSFFREKQKSSKKSFRQTPCVYFGNPAKRYKNRLHAAKKYGTLNISIIQKVNIWNTHRILQCIRRC